MEVVQYHLDIIGLSLIHCWRGAGLCPFSGVVPGERRQVGAGVKVSICEDRIIFSTVRSKESELFKCLVYDAIVYDLLC